MPRLGTNTESRGSPADLTVQVTASPKLVGYATLAGLFLLAGILFRRPEPAAIGIVFLAAAVFGVARVAAPRLQLAARLDRDQIIEGDSAAVELEISSPSSVPWLQVLATLPAGIEPKANVMVQTVELQRNARRRLTIPLNARRWGRFPIALVIVAARDQLGFFAFQTQLQQELELRVFPTEDRIARAIRPLETQMFSGDEVARRKGDGIEFADVRPFEPGDRVRRINWAVSSRLAKLHVNELHPERNTDVVVFLDSFSDVGAAYDSTLLAAVRATASVARHYLSRRDRVGLVRFGGTLRWQLPAMGVPQAYKILDALLSTDSMFSYAWKGIDVIPTRTLPPKSLVVAITPLIDERTVSALFDLRGRGFDLVIVEVSPERFISRSVDESQELALRLWRLKRQALRNQYWQAGVPVTTWSSDRPLAASLQEIARFRQFAPRSRVL